MRIAIGRASDLSGPGVSGSTFGERVFASTVAARRADFLADSDLPHTYSYVPDIAADLATPSSGAVGASNPWIFDQSPASICAPKARGA